MNQQIISEFEKSVNEFIHALSLFTQEQINRVPSGGGWTSGKVARHIIKAIGGMPDLLEHGKVEKTEREPDAKEQELKDIFLDFNAKYESPSFIVPEDTAYNREDLIKTLTEAVNGTVKGAKNKDLTLTSKEFEMPGSGYLTLYELLCLGTYHTQRHTRQLKKIYATTPL